MILFTKTFTRPNTNIKFHHEVLDNSLFKNHLKKNYYDTGKLLSEKKITDESNLILTYKSLWNSRSDFDEYDNDPVLTLYWSQRDDYNRVNNIVTGEKIFKEVEN